LSEANIHTSSTKLIVSVLDGDNKVYLNKIDLFPLGVSLLDEFITCEVCVKKMVACACRYMLDHSSRDNEAWPTRKHENINKGIGLKLSIIALLSQQYYHTVVLLVAASKLHHHVFSPLTITFIPSS
jgi:hypothetical protein